MEYIWYVIAALGAGVGTGLAGLSAATVMVPILIVLCPSFAGETGAYHATAIAMASDILGSAVTAGIYIKHRNIDLRRGWIMLACIVAMCVAGSLAAWQAGNVVLGGFSLFLTFAIGIRFLLKPDTQRKQTVAKGSGLNWKGVCISLFFGLTIGFGTGFFGSGGGMMMLVVFTAFLGMERRTAVGTSTFIMTFTALIAFVSHAKIDPTIWAQRKSALVVCIAVATTASILSAQFANRVAGRLVGLVTGGVLTVLGGAMLLIQYWDLLSGITLLRQVMECSASFLIYIACGATLLILLRFTCLVPKVVFRKLLHFVAFSSSVNLVFLAENWMAASLTAALFAAVVYPILKLLEDFPWFSGLFVQKKGGEIKKSLLILYLSQAVLIALCWGVFAKPYIAAAATVTWGFGDTAAALIGKRFGKHRVKIKFADPNKTWEGTAAMALVSFVSCAAMLLLFGPLSWSRCFFYALLVAPVSSATELCSHNGNDTATVPYAVALILWLASFL